MHDLSLLLLMSTFVTLSPLPLVLISRLLLASLQSGQGQTVVAPTQPLMQQAGEQGNEGDEDALHDQ